MENQIDSLPFWTHGDIIMVMRKKEIPLPTSRGVAESLGRIEEATWEEELERKRQGLTQEPERKTVAKKQPYDIEPIYDAKPLEEPGGKPGGIKEWEAWVDKNRWRKEDIEDFVKKWLEQNPSYEFEEIKPEETEILDNSGINIPPEFVDHLISIAMSAIKKKNLVLFGDVEKVKIKPISDRPEVICLVIKDELGATVILHFYAIPPFNLKEVNSTSGIYHFAR